MQRHEASEIGFLRQRHSQDKYESFAREGHIKVATINNEVVGFVVALPWNHSALAFERNALSIVAWSGESYADPGHRVFRDAIFVDEVGIDPQLHKRGIGRHLYGEIMNDHPQSYLVATSMEEPVLNQCSAAFHRALGFNRVGEFTVAEFQGLAPYRCGVGFVLSSPSTLQTTQSARRLNPHSRFYL